MSTRRRLADAWVQRPAVTSTIAYGGLVAVWFLWIACTLRFPTVFDEAPYRLIGTPLYLAFTAANVGLALWLFASFRGARAAGPGLRRGQLAGLALSLVFVGVLQAGAQGLHAAWPHEDGRDPAKIAAYLESRTPDDRAVLEAARDEFLAVSDAVEVALDEHHEPTLVFRDGALWLGGARAEGGRATIWFHGNVPVGAEAAVAPWAVETGPLEGFGRLPRVTVESRLVAKVPAATRGMVRKLLSWR